MAHAINAVPLNVETGTTGNNGMVKVDKIPNECPLCHVTAKPQYLPSSTPTHTSDWLEVYFRCSACGHHFTANYKFEGLSGQNQNYLYKDCRPQNPVPAKFDDDIAALSPRFVNIVGQAAEAEARSLDEIAGPGYRKALEFLVKDYAIRLNSADREKIKSLAFASVITTYLQGDKLPVVSSRAGSLAMTKRIMRRGGLIRIWRT